VPLAKSWLRPAKLEVKSGCTSEGYDRSQRAYVLADAGAEISVVVKASKRRPMINPAFVIKNWGEADAALSIDGEKIKCGESFRYGYRKTAKGSDLIVWIKKESTKPVQISFSPR
jgi:hypothetical protein